MLSFHSDVDECIQGTDTCGRYQTCVNTEGGYSCNCSKGMNLVNGVCEDIDECKQSPCKMENGYCVNKPRGFGCFCNANKIIIDNVCHSPIKCPSQLKSCDPITTHQCYNNGTDYGCKCGSGYEHEPGSIIKCRDIDECSTNAHYCNDRGQYCVNKIPYSSCDCFPGYKKLDGYYCEDINECSDAKAKKCLGGQCVNTIGGFYCRCPIGYFEINGTCSDIDECSRPRGSAWSHNCSSHSHCNNTIGSFLCACDSGFAWDSTSQSCKDINECKSNVTCENAFCVNTLGSFRCLCNKGFQLVNNSCIEVLEQGDKSKVGMPANAHCGETLNENKVQCLAGFYKNANGTCSNVNECNTMSDACHYNADCYDTVGSYTCVCRNGYYGDGKESCHAICRRGLCRHRSWCIVRPENDYWCSCQCEGDQCRVEGAVCDTEGMSHVSEKALIEHTCKLDKDVQVDYYGNCKGNCSDVKCPSNTKCVMRNDRPTCDCPDCTAEDQEPQVFCTESGLQFATKCQHIMRLCETKMDDPVAYEGPCKRPMKCTLSPWMEWSPCSVSCEVGTRTRRRMVLRAAQYGGSCDSQQQTEECYNGACPGSACANSCPVAAYCEKDNCVCPKCTDHGSQPVCGQINGQSNTFNNPCQLRKAACQVKSNYSVIHEGACEDYVPHDPLNCTVVSDFQIITRSDNCSTALPLEVNKCDGGCGSDAETCCRPTKFNNQRVLFNCPNGTNYHEEEKVISECACEKK